MTKFRIKDEYNKTKELSPSPLETIIDTDDFAIYQHFAYFKPKEQSAVSTKNHLVSKVRQKNVSSRIKTAFAPLRLQTQQITEDLVANIRLSLPAFRWGKKPSLSLKERLKATTSSVTKPLLAGLITASTLMAISRFSEKSDDKTQSFKENALNIISNTLFHPDPVPYFFGQLHTKPSQPKTDDISAQEDILAEDIPTETENHITLISEEADISSQAGSSEYELVDEQGALRPDLWENDKTLYVNNYSDRYQDFIHSSFSFTVNEDAASFFTKDAPVYETTSDPGQGFRNKAYKALFNSMARVESGCKGYHETPFTGLHGGYAFGRYQFLGSTLVGHGYLEYVDSNPDTLSLPSLRDWRKQDITSEYMTLYIPPIHSYNHVRWTGKDGMHNLNDFINTRKGHIVQDRLVEKIFINNTRYMQHKASHLIGTIQDHEYTSVHKNENGEKVPYHNYRPVLITAEGLAWGAHLLGADRTIKIVENGFKTTPEMPGYVDFYVPDIFVRYLTRHPHLDPRMTHDRLLRNHPDYDPKKHKAISMPLSEWEKLQERKRDQKTFSDTLQSLFIQAVEGLSDIQKPVLDEMDSLTRGPKELSEKKQKPIITVADSALKR